LKKQLANEKGITLIVIPYWWNGKDGRYPLPYLEMFMANFQLFKA